MVHVDMPIMTTLCASKKVYWSTTQSLCLGIDLFASLTVVAGKSYLNQLAFKFLAMGNRNWFQSRLTQNVSLFIQAVMIYQYLFFFLALNRILCCKFNSA